MIIRSFVATCIALATATASAGIVSTTGAVQQAAPPFTVQQNVIQSDTAAIIFPERQGLTLAAGLALNVSASGLVNETADLSPFTIPTGTKINSYLIHADTLGSATLQGEVVFAEPILGIIALTPELQASHLTVGLTGTVTYPANGSNDAQAAGGVFAGTLTSDDLLLNLPARSVKFTAFASSSGFGTTYNHFRVITASNVVPEPVSVLLVVGGLVAAAFLRLW